MYRSEQIRQEVGIDINSYQWSCYASSKKKSLLSLTTLVATSEDDRASFDYLMARKDVDINAPAEEGDQDPFWRDCFIVKASSSLSFFKALVNHESFDPNAPSERHHKVELPLHYTILATVSLFESEGISQRIAKTQALLDVGADPMLGTSSYPPPLEYADRVLRTVQDDPEKVQICKRLIAMMEEKLAAT